MKAAKEYREQWEEANLLRLIVTAERVYEKINHFLKQAIIVLNVLVYIMFQAIKGLLLIIKLLLMTEPAINRIERDETWIFRQIK